MSEISEVLANSKKAYTSMNKSVDTKNVVRDVLNIIFEDKDGIEEANSIDVKNENGFKIDFNIIEKLKNSISNLNDLYRQIIYLNKTEDKYLDGKQLDNIGTVCLAYDGNTYCFIELALKALLTHNSLIVISQTDYMKGTNELILILIRRILDAYGIDKNIIQIFYTTEIEKFLSNNISINKVIAVGKREFQDNIKKVSKIEVIAKGYNDYDIYIENLNHLKFINKIIETGADINIYAKSDLNVPFEDYTEVSYLDEAIAQINSNTSGYAATIFTEDKENATLFLRNVKSSNLFVNASPLMNDILNFDINLLLTQKRMFYPSPLSDNDKNKFEFKINKMNSNTKEISNDEANNKSNNINQELEQKENEIKELKRKLEESQNMTNKYMGAFRKSFFARIFGRIGKEEIEKDNQLLS